MALAQDFSQEQDFPERNCSSVLLELRRSSPSSFSVEADPAESGEECSGGVLEPCWSNLLREKPVFPQVVRCDEIAPRNILHQQESSVRILEELVE
jgi:hypothetical protein